MRLVNIQWLALVGLAFLLSACGEAKRDEISLVGNTMGTFYSVKVASVDGVDATTLKAQIDTALKVVNQQMSTYIKDSELSRFNQSRELRPFGVSIDTAAVVSRAIELGRQTQGALDITVGPLVNLWGFGPDKRPSVVPSQTDIDNVLKRVGLQHLVVKTRFDGNYLQKDRGDLYLDLSAIAKGFGVDKIAQLLESEGVANYLVDIGGEVRVSGVNGKGVPWSVAVEKPTAQWGSVQRVLAIGDNAIATSGDYRNFYKLDGKVYAHEINPKTGKPEKTDLLSVSVIAPSCMDADGYATAFMVMGEAKALMFAKAHKLAVYLLVRDGDTIRESYSPAFNRYLKEK